MNACLAKAQHFGVETIRFVVKLRELARAKNGGERFVRHDEAGSFLELPTYDAAFPMSTRRESHRLRLPDNHLKNAPDITGPVQFSSLFTRQQHLPFA